MLQIRLSQCMAQEIYARQRYLTNRQAKPSDSVRTTYYNTGWLW